MSNSGTNAVRSPSYPSMSLADAVASVRKIEALYRTAQVDRLAGAKILGYSGLSGPANKALAALAQYGLVERAGKGEMRVTSRALAILHPNNPEERAQNLRMAAIEPNLFRELAERFPNMVPPEDGVVTYLNRQGFNQTAIRPATKAYLQTLLFLEESGVSESHGVTENNDAESTALDNLQENNVSQPLHTMPKPPSQAEAISMVADALAGSTLNKINMNIQGDRVRLDGVLDYKGLVALEKKITSLKVLLQPIEDEGDDDA